MYEVRHLCVCVCPIINTWILLSVFWLLMKRTECSKRDTSTNLHNYSSLPTPTPKWRRRGKRSFFRPRLPSFIEKYPTMWNLKRKRYPRNVVPITNPISYYLSPISITNTLCQNLATTGRDRYQTWTGRMGNRVRHCLTNNKPRGKYTKILFQFPHKISKKYSIFKSQNVLVEMLHVVDWRLYICRFHVN